MSSVLTSRSLEVTRRIAQQVAATLQPGDVIALSGDLGAGKTTLVRDIVMALHGDAHEVTSPTFTLMNVYHMTTLPPNHLTTFAHIDTYRLKNERELIDIGVEDYLGEANTVCVIEWPEKIQKLLQRKKTIEVTLSYMGNEKREIVIRNT